MDSKDAQEARDYQWRAEQGSLARSGAAPKKLPQSGRRGQEEHGNGKETTKTTRIPWVRVPGMEQNLALRTKRREVVRRRLLDDGTSRI